MPLSASVVVFVSVVFIAMALLYAWPGESPQVSKRLGQLWRVPGRERFGLKQARRKLTDWILSGIARFIPSAERGSEGDPRLVMAGFRRPEAISALRAAKVAAIAVLMGLVYVTGLYKTSDYPIVHFVVAIVAGFILPDMWVSRQIQNRQEVLRLALPDALDLLVICMEAGLGLDQALLYVSQELRLAHPELCEELDIVNAEMHVGKSRIDALRSLAKRTGVEDLQALVATLVQTDRFGTSVAQSLRVHSDELRTKRRQRAEEMAAKTTVKMVIPLVFFIFPALFVVILGPAVITMIHTLGGLQR